MSLHFDMFPQVGRHIEVFALDDCRFAFLKTTAGHGFELQDFLLSGCNWLLAGPLLLLPRYRFFLRRAHRGLGLAVTSEYYVWFVGGRCCDWCRFSRDRFFERKRFLESCTLANRFFSSNFWVRCCGLVLLSHGRCRGRSAWLGRRLQQPCVPFRRERAD